MTEPTGRAEAPREHSVSQRHDAPILVVEDAVCDYRLTGGGRFRAVDGVSLEIGRGEVLGLVGESGCGKSSLAKLICGLEKLSDGHITFEESPVRHLRYRRRPAELLGIQMVFQNPYASLNPRRRVGAQIADALALDPERRWTVGSLLAAVDLEPSAAQRYPHAFSGGQRQRIAIARALGAGPRLLIGDEPISSLDAFLQSQIARMMRDLAAESGTSLLFISHDLSIVREIADRVSVMEAGRIVETGPIEHVWGDPQHPYSRRLISAIPRVDGEGVIPGGPVA